MNNIKVNIKKIVNENLQKTRKQRFDESFTIVSESKNSDEFLNNVLIASSNLISEGYEINEIEDYINELDVKSMVSSGDNALDQVKNADWGGIMKGTIMSSIKEYAIKWLLNNLGMKGEITDFMATVFADYNPIKLLKPFKDMQTCMQSDAMPALCDAIMEGLGRFIGNKMVSGGGDSTIKLGIGNIFGESIKESNIGETAGAKFCSLIHG